MPPRRSLANHDLIQSVGRALAACEHQCPVFPPAVVVAPESLRYELRMILLVTAGVGGSVMTVTYKLPQTKETGSLYALTATRVEGLNPNVGNVQVAVGELTS